MKLCRYGNIDNELPAVVVDAIRYDVSAFTNDFDEKFFGTDGITKLKTWFTANKSQCKIVDASERWAACVARPSKIICIGLNYNRLPRI